MAETNKGGVIGMTEEVVDMISVARVSEVLSKVYYESVDRADKASINLPGAEFALLMERVSLISYIASTLGVPLVRRSTETKIETVKPSGRPSDRKVVAY